jgi:hypothetical protein
MNTINIIVKSPIDISNIKSHDLYHHIDDIPATNILEYNVNILENIENDTIYDLVVVYNKDGNKVKRTSKIKATKTRTQKRVIERRNMSKFGAATISNDGITVVGDEVFLEPPKSYMVDQTPNIKSEDISKMKFSDRRKLKSYQEKKIKEETVKPTKSFNKYEPPSKRNTNNGSSTERLNKYTVFVSGFQEDFTRNNLIDMIPQNIRSIKISLPTANNKCKGFGFIDVNTQEDMNSIINFFDGKLYEYAVLHANEKKNKSY